MANKIDVLTKDELAEDKRKIFDDLEKEGVHVFWTSTVTGEGIMELRQAACDKLLLQRVDAKMRGKKTNNIMNRLRVATPMQRDNKERPPFIPEAILKKRAALAAKEGATVNEDESVTMETDEKRKTERDLEIELEDDYVLDLQKWWDLKNPEEKNDVLPEIINGKNIADYIDADIFQKLEALEKEEELREEAGFYDDEEESEDEEAKDIRQLAAKIREKKGLRMLESKMRRKIEKPRLPGKVAAQDRGSRDLMKDLGELGIDFNGLENAHFRSRSLTRKAKKRKFDDGDGDETNHSATTTGYGQFSAAGAGGNSVQMEWPAYTCGNSAKPNCAGGNFGLAGRYTLVVS